MENTISTKLEKNLKNQKGFTLIEIIAVLVILGILASVAVARNMDLIDKSKQKTADSAILELNSREKLYWAKLNISPSGYIDDKNLRDTLDYNLGSDFLWDHGPKKDHGTLDFNGELIDLLRTESTNSQPAVWVYGSFH